MKRTIYAGCLALTLLLLAASPARAWRGGHEHGPRPHVFFRPHVAFSVGPTWWWGPPWWAFAPPVVVEAPPVYIERAPSQAYWYYCPSAGQYYPNVRSCPEPWVTVPPRPE
jgi:hypothetical protein